MLVDIVRVGADDWRDVAGPVALVEHGAALLRMKSSRGLVRRLLIFGMKLAPM
jgi:hypothetical protein